MGFPGSLFILNQRKIGCEKWIDQYKEPKYKANMDNKNIFKTAAIITSFFFICSSYAQTTQIIKGTITDEASHYPIAGVEIALLGSDRIKTLSDENGNYILENVPVGRQTFIIASLNYKDHFFYDVLVTSGKAVQLNAALKENVTQLENITIVSKRRASPGNEMQTVSAIDFRSEDTRKFAGSFGDPSRMLVNFAGLSNASDSRNDIVVRGNSPNGLLWRLEGIDIINPNHFGELTNTGGPVSIINSNNLGKLSFYFGAFPAQFGNALSGVFDLNLKNGTIEKTEITAEIGFSGLEAGIEGPISKKRKASYMLNYRYSTLGIMKLIGLNFGTGNTTPYYQDLNFKIYVPLTEKSKLSYWGMGGPSSIRFLAKDADTLNPNTFFIDNLQSEYFTAISGLSLETNYNSKTFGRLNIGFNYGSENAVEDSVSMTTGEAFRSMETSRKTRRWSATYDIAHKLSAKDNFVSGININQTRYIFSHKQISGGGTNERIHFDQKNNMFLLKGYTQWKHQFTDKFFSTFGFHLQLLSFNATCSLEPRAGLQYKINHRHSLKIGYGLHSQLQNPLVYFYPSKNATDEGIYTNEKLGFTKSHHFVTSYNYWISGSLLFKTEIYYQYIFNVPVEKVLSAFSALNIGGLYDFPLKADLINKGTGKNYGMELGLQKYFSDQYYFLLNGSLFKSNYKGSDGIERNTPFNSTFSCNLLGGKDFSLREDVLSLNLNITGLGGRSVSPVDIEQSRAAGTTVYQHDINPFSIKQKTYFRADIKIGYRTNTQKTTMELGVDIRNITNRKNIFMQRYSRIYDSVVEELQQGFLIIPYFRWHF
ncbi:MAG TPA: carboxypeptidase-like regulatory domain-containing protein [Niabella sp.]|nr:carboxypeptidase-like regulatory domain-containing protein [Niabella sp.]